MQINVDKSFFATVEVDYLGYIINRSDITPQPAKVQIIVDMTKPTTSTGVKRFEGMVNFYRDLWPKRAHYLALIMALTAGKKKNGPIIWTQEAIDSFEKIKTIIAEDAMLHYPDFNKEFEIHTDSSNYQMGAVISQGGRPVAYWSKKLTETQQKYPTTDQELLAIVECLKQYKTMLLGQTIFVSGSFREPEPVLEGILTSSTKRIVDGMV